jgi:uncharacterized protein with von Willebrand factor type A (vWA) domain
VAALAQRGVVEALRPSLSDGGRAMARRVLGFVRQARLNGFPVGLPEAIDLLDWLRSNGSGLPAQAELRDGFRALLCGRQADWAKFDEIFEAYWLGRGMKSRISGSAPGLAKGLKRAADEIPPVGQPGMADHVERGEQGAPADGRGRARGASTDEALATTDLRHLNDPAALEQAALLAERLARSMRDRLTRRRTVARRGRALDFRRTIRRSVATGGAPFDPRFRRRRRKPVRLVVLLDVSGSMSQYSAFFLRFLRGIIAHFADAEAFVFHTRLVSIGEVLREREPHRALDRLSLISAGFSGGTRIGESLAEFERHYAARLLNRRAVVIIVSDGYDTGDPVALGAALAAIKRRARRIAWLNPMAGWEGYEPVAAGMAAAMPHLDLFAPAHNLASLAALEPLLARL